MFEKVDAPKETKNFALSLTWPWRLPSPGPSLDLSDAQWTASPHRSHQAEAAHTAQSLACANVNLHVMFQEKRVQKEKKKAN